MRGCRSAKSPGPASAEAAGHVSPAAHRQADIWPATWISRENSAFNNTHAGTRPSHKHAQHRGSVLFLLSSWWGLNSAGGVCTRRVWVSPAAVLRHSVAGTGTSRPLGRQPLAPVAGTETSPTQQPVQLKVCWPSHTQTQNRVHPHRV